jgi:hypothetical protein
MAFFNPSTSALPDGSSGRSDSQILSAVLAAPAFITLADASDNCIYIGA